MLTTTLLAVLLSHGQAKATITVDTGRPGIRISPDLYGIFFEEINCGGDGGLYAEMVRNRSFEDDPKEPVHWIASTTGSMELDHENGVSAGDPTSLKMTIHPNEGSFSATNEGYWGIPLRKGARYRFSFYARSVEPNRQVEVHLLDSASAPAGGKTIAIGQTWKEYATILTSDRDDPKGALSISSHEAGTMWIDMVSLFPEDTFKNRQNGLRRDLAQKLADLHPSFMRFPGGCWVEGDTMAFSQRWKQTIGDLKDRRTQYDLWQYMSTNGLGFHEYLQLCEDIGAAPLFVINVGMSHHGVVPLDQMDPYVQDALDAIEYANGPVTSKWGTMRAANGHPGSFHLKYLEIGNENGGPNYDARYPLIAKAVKARYPDIHLIANVWGGYPTGPLTEIVDEHYYSNPQFFFDNADKYDHYDRKGPQVYVGEYACTEGCGQGNLIAAVSEAAFMTGMERNSDVVRMCSYAPLFANVEHKTWNPDLINFDNHRSLGTPSYYVQQMFSTNRGDVILPTSVRVEGVRRSEFPHGSIGVGTWGTQAEFKDIEVTVGGKTTKASLSPGAGKWEAKDGVYAQSGPDEPSLASAPVEGETYTLTLKARKTGGREGFLIYAGMSDPKTWIWWNVGGWGNRQDALERSVGGSKGLLGRSLNGSVETGRWYDVKIEYSPERIKCYLDGKLIHDETAPEPKPLDVVASRVDKTGEVILKIVNTSDAPISTTLKGLPAGVSGTRITLTSASPADENTLDDPMHVSPKTSSFTGPDFTFPAYSVTILRCRA
ncbi:MAG TPA: alpha-L-arabinofuranosidase C-terminal domain-containing protein [Fimbriimonadaceae bacterium]|nr:alpha-L-arabinofuranosidase C-terminal domain-containing protein [Fimbriimonadaceae bacterium]